MRRTSRSRKQSSSSWPLKTVKGWTKPGGTGLYNIYIMEELHSILSLGAGGSTKMVGGGQIRRAFNAKYPREYIDRPEKRRANLMDFARFYAEQGE